MDDVISGLDSLINVVLPNLAESVKQIASKGRNNSSNSATVYVPPDT